MNITDLIQDVRRIINEVAVENDTFTAEADAAIREFVRAAMVHLAAMPSYQGTPTITTDKSNIQFSPRPDGMMYAVIQPPADFLRPVSLKLQGWIRPVTVFLPAHGSSFLSQYSSAPGIGAGPNSPAAFITSDAGSYIIAHSVQAETTYSLSYMAVPSVGADGTVSVPDRYRDALAYTASAFYLQSVNEYDAAKAAFDTAASYIQIIDNKQIPSE